MSVYPVRKLNKPIKAEVKVPGSKSITNRALLLSALSSGECILNNPLESDDTKNFLKSLKQMGFNIVEKENFIEVSGKGGNIPAKEGTIDVGSAGTAARFLSALISVSDTSYIIKCSSQMAARPMKQLFDAVASLGTEVEYLGASGHLPVKLTGCNYNKNKSDNSFGKQYLITIPSDVSTQFLSGLLIAAPTSVKSGGDFYIKATGDRTKGSYVKMTLNMMEAFGINVKLSDDGYIVNGGQCYKNREYDIEPDVSSACYFYAAAALCGGSVKVRGVYKNSIQGDIKFLDLLEKMGAVISEEDDGIRLTSKGKLKGIDVYMTDFSDQAITLAAIAPFCESEVTIRGIGHIRGQESNRIAAICTELNRLGVVAEELKDGVRIYPAEKIIPSTINTYEDHRIAMAFTLVGLKADGIKIDNPECSKKTYANFFVDLEKLYN